MCAVTLGALRDKKAEGGPVGEGQLAVAERNVLAAAMDYYDTRKRKENGILV